MPVSYTRVKEIGKELATLRRKAADTEAFFAPWEGLVQNVTQAHWQRLHPEQKKELSDSGAKEVWFTERRRAIFSRLGELLLERYAEEMYLL